MATDRLREPAVERSGLRPCRVDANLIRNRRAARLLHAAVYGLTIGLIYTGWWLLSGHEGRPSVIARAVRLPDTTVHPRLGWALIGVIAVGTVVWRRSTVGFLRETVTFRRSDLRWALRWPLAVFTGRFARHDGRFDPGQRVFNLAAVIGLAILAGTGIGLGIVHSGATYASLLRVHKLTTYALVPILAGHVLIACGVLPGYRGAWRAMHFGGRVPRRTAQRLWPEWVRRHDSDARAR